MEPRPYVFVETNDIIYHTRLKGLDFSNDWLDIRENGQITLLGSNPKCQGYAWDGCSPKFFFWDIYVGTPDGIVDLFSAKPKTYYASLIHDALYQFRHEYKEQVSRKTTDLIFLDELQLNKFALSLLYYRIVRWFGWIYWNDLMRRLPQLKYIFLLFTLLLLWLLFSLLNLGIHAVFQFFTAWF